MDKLAHPVKIKASFTIRLVSYQIFRNYSTGQGVNSPYTHAQIISPRRLTFADENALYSNGFIQTLVNLLPTECSGDWFRPNREELKRMSLTSEIAQEVIDYLDQIHFVWEEKHSDKIDVNWDTVRNTFAAASRIGRKHGDGFVLLLIADGKDSNEPVDMKNVHSFNGMVLLDRSQVMIPDYSYALDPCRPARYKIYPQYVLGGEAEALVKPFSWWHSSRILRFPGTYPDRDTVKSNQGFNYSCLQLVIDAFSCWYQGIMSGADMLKNYNQMLLKVDNLLELIDEDQQTGTSTNQAAIQNRLRMVEQFSSILHMVVIDGKREGMESLTRSYQGADKIMGELRRLLEASIDIPLDQAFGSSKESALNSPNTAGLANRFEWANCKRTFAGNFWLRNFHYIARLATVAKDSPVRNTDPRQLLFEPGSEVSYTKKEQTDMQSTEATIEEKWIKNGIYTAEEIRAKREGKPMPKSKPQNQTANPKDQTVQTDETLATKGKTNQTAQDQKSNQRNGSRSDNYRSDDAQTEAILSDADWDRMASVSAADFVSTAMDLLES